MDAPINQQIQSIYGLVETVPLGRFKTAAFACIRQVLPFNAGLWIEGEAETQTPHSAHFHNLPADLLEHYYPYAGDDRLYEAIVANPGRTYLMSDFYSLEEILQLRIYREFGRHYGIFHAAATALVHKDLGLYSFIAFYRDRHDPPFTERDLRFKQALTPHLLTAYRLKLFQALLAEETCNDHQSVTAVMDRQGVIHHASLSLAPFLREAWPGWRGPCVPEAVLQAVAGGRKSFFVDHLFFDASTLPNDLIFLRGRRMNHLDVLSVSESRVAFLLSQGWTYKEVGRDLGISPSTVTNHVNHIYRKLDIHSKSELRRFFRS
ncbi:hypothetical protein MIT9_P0312 [Methylomarinovum caldicuralii]|uniref:HTH luxR-type domain-containing protein n=1 Tax=Methylomarinovum caldicuralii TaxID=438856 RepID=A0AAU9C5Q5_9GAMM|nr:helix-turn-helix transcriptional regulator [Methylomarinovum caldicuralii]BCX80736.1 hypothetical protein MIT9_P0312 [Methylomarinovum caldicuralii]